jgi:hypothetical protein
MDISNGNASRMFLSKNTGEEFPPKYITTDYRWSYKVGLVQLQSREGIAI